MTLAELGRHWETLAQHDPLWAILSDPAKRRGRWQADEFFATGTREVEWILDRVKALGLAPGTGAALDFGCGVGRLTHALARHFSRVEGVDISPTMIALAREHNRGGERCRFSVNDSGDLSRFPAATFDMVYTNLVLQHIERRYTEGYLVEFLRVLRPGGVLVFQLPSVRPAEATAIRLRIANGVKRWLVRLDASGALYRIGLLKSPAVMECHAFERTALEAFLTRHGGRVEAVDPLGHVAIPYMTFCYFVTRTA